MALDRFRLEAVANWLENWCGDCESLHSYLNHNIRRGAPVLVPTPYQPPQNPPAGTPAPGADEHLADAVLSLNNLCDNVAAMGQARFGITPANPLAARTPGAPVNPSDEDLLDLSARWLELTSGLFKSLIHIYGATPLPMPTVSSPGGATEDKLTGEIAARLSKNAADWINFLRVRAMGFTNLPAPAKPPFDSTATSLNSLEKGFHRLFMDFGSIANGIPGYLTRPKP